MRVLVCGSRTFDEAGLVWEYLQEYDSEDLVVVHGGAPGADSCTAFVCQDQGWKEEVYMADWKKHGRAAGPIRNQAMIDSGPDLVLAFYDGKRTKGTEDTVERAKKAGIKVEEIGL